jgi:glycosyltransferase involved in cell wall biosynthesis
MRLCIDATPLLLRSAGVKNYVYYWIQALRRAGPKQEISLFPFFSAIGGLDHERSMAGRAATLGGLALLHARNYLGFPLPRWDVFHASHQLQRPPANARLTSTIHDMTCWSMPELHRKRNVDFTRRFGERFLPRAAGLIAVSECTRQDAIRILRLDPARVTTIHSGVGEPFFKAAPARRARPYFLYVGTIEPRKNIETLLDAWAALPPSLRAEHDLVIAGPAGWNVEPTMARLRSGKDGVEYLGYVPEADLPSLTAGALAFVYPSLYEGFGFPVAQALAAGAPVITSNVSSLPEIAGDAAILVDPRSVSELRDALERVALSPSLRDDLARRGRARAQCFRWDECARRSLEFFNRVAGE